MAKDREIKKKDLVTVYGTGANAHLERGKAYKVHSIVAEKLQASGAASATQEIGEGDKKVKR